MIFIRRSSTVTLDYDSFQATNQSHNYAELIERRLRIDYRKNQGNSSEERNRDEQREPGNSSTQFSAGYNRTNDDRRLRYYWAGYQLLLRSLPREEVYKKGEVVSVISADISVRARKM